MPVNLEVESSPFNLDGVQFDPPPAQQVPMDSAGREEPDSQTIRVLDAQGQVLISVSLRELLGMAEDPPA